MKVHGIDITDSIIEGALKKALKESSSGKNITSTQFTRILEEDYEIPQYANSSWPSRAAASRILQKLKKEGRIVKVYGGGWRTIWELTKKRKK